MTRDEAEHALAAAGRKPEDEFVLFDAALLCAVHDDPARDPSAARAVANEAADRLARRLQRQPCDEALADALCQDLDFSGDVITYDDLANADLISVCARRKGLPVALGVLFLTAARACELDLSGADFPAHFLLRLESEEGPLALDPFAGGRVVLPSELVRRALHAGLPPRAADDLERLMEPVPDKRVLTRLQSNVFARAFHAGDFRRAERAAIRRALLEPTDHRPWIDVAAAREAQGALNGALEAMSRAAEITGGDTGPSALARERLRRRLN
ncbi:MAG TPA: transglutaminase family protein [Caulobacteraceae bacterium]|jgi:regulator of sirC expression with transglutaminase-like and TPR domain